MHKMANLPYQEVLANRVIYGTPEQVVDRITKVKEDLGITGLVMECNYGGRIPYERVINSLRLISEKVIPNFR